MPFQVSDSETADARPTREGWRAPVQDSDEEPPELNIVLTPPGIDIHNGISILCCVM